MRRLPTALALIPLLFSDPASAQVQIADSGDTAWMLLCTALVSLAAVAGVALRFAGAVPARDAPAAMARVLMAAVIASLLWASVGNMLAFAPGPLWLGQIRSFSAGDMAALHAGVTIPEIAFLFFQLAVACLASALLTGVFGGYRLLPVTLLTGAWLMIVYAPVVRAVSAGGWLARSGVVDFSGAFSLHLVTGVSALTASVILGRRRTDDRAHGASVLGVAGSALVWLGSLGISGGWAFGATVEAVAAILNSHLAACAAALAWAIVERVRTGQASASGVSCGALAGLAAISASAGFTDIPGAILIGLGAGVVCQFATMIPHLLGGHDPANIFAVHAVGGLIGALLLALVNNGLHADVLLINQAVGAGAVLLWSATATALLTLPFLFLKRRRSGDAGETTAPDAF